MPYVPWGRGKGAGIINIKSMAITKLLFVTSLTLICLIIPTGSYSSRFILLANAQTNSNTTISSPNTSVQQWKTYSDKNLGLSLQYPSTWEIKPKTNRFEGGPELKIERGVNSFSVIRSPMEGMGDAKVFAEVGKDRLTSSPDRRLIEDVKKTDPIGGEEAFSFMYIKEAEDGGTIKTVQQLFAVVHNDTGYGFGFTGVSTSFDNPEQIEIRNGILKSIKFLDGSKSSSNSSSDNVQTITNGFLLYQSPANGFKIQYPSGWQILNDTDRSSSHVIFYKSSSSSSSSTPSDTDTSNLYLQYLRSNDADVSAGVQITDYSGQPLEELVQSQFAIYARAFFHFEIIESTPTSLDGNPAYKEIHTFADDKGKAYTYTSIYAAKDDKLYQVWYRVVSEQYPSYQKVGQKILDSFQFTGLT